jgi:hypothetical protein
MAAFAALQALARTDHPRPGAEATMPLLALLAGVAGARLHAARPLPSRRAQEMMLAAVPMP